MALKNAFMIKAAPITAQSELKVTAKVGESLLIKRLHFGALTSGGFAEILIDRVSVGFFYIGDINANHLEQYEITSAIGNVFDRLIAKGLMVGYPVAEGQTFEVRPHTAGTQVVGTITYEVHDAGDMTSDMPNGSAGLEFLFLNYGTNTSQISTTSTGTLDKTRNPSEYPAFPFGEVVPANYTMEILGILLMVWKDAQGNNNPNYAYLKLVKDRSVMFDDDRAGICVREGMGFLTWGPCRQVSADITLFPAPLVFESGDELLIQMTSGGTVIAADDIMLATIQKATRTA